MPNPLKDFLGILRNNHYITESARSAQRKFGEFWTKERLPEVNRVFEQIRTNTNKPGFSYIGLDMPKYFDSTAKSLGLGVTYNRDIESAATDVMNRHWPEIFNAGFQIHDTPYSPSDRRRLGELSSLLSQRHPSINWNQYDTNEGLGKLLTEIKESGILEPQMYDSSILPWTIDDMSWFAEYNPLKYNWTPPSFFHKYGTAIADAVPSGFTDAVNNTSVQAESMRIGNILRNYGTDPGQWTLTNLGGIDFNTGNNAASKQIIAKRTGPTSLFISAPGYERTVSYPPMWKDLVPAKDATERSLLRMLNGKYERYKRLTGNGLGPAYIQKIDPWSGNRVSEYNDFWQKLLRLPEGGTEMYTPHVNRPILIGNKHEEGGKITRFKSKLHK